VVDSAIVALEASSRVMQSQRRRAGARGDVTINGALVCSGLASPTGNVTLLGDLCNKGEMFAASVVTTHLKTGSVKVDKLITAKGSLAIKGKIQVSGTVAGLMNSTCDNLQIAESKQFATVFLETFEQAEDTAGWSNTRTSQCAGNTILGGHCNFAGGEVSKTYHNLPEHDTLKLSANFLFLDSWEGEKAYAKIGDSFIWLDSHNAAEAAGAPNMCGGPTPNGSCTAGGAPQSMPAAVEQ